MTKLTRSEFAEVLEHVAVQLRTRGKSTADALTLPALLREAVAEVCVELERRREDRERRCTSRGTARARVAAALASALAQEDA